MNLSYSCYAEQHKIDENPFCLPCFMQSYLFCYVKVRPILHITSKYSNSDIFHSQTEQTEVQLETTE